MTLRKITFHKNIVKSEKIEGQEVTETKFADLDNKGATFQKSGFYNPEVAQRKLDAMEEAGFEKPTHYDPNKLAEMPQGFDDSRSLLEARFSLEIEVENQGHIKSGLVELYEDAITTANSKMNAEADDKGRVRYFDGIKEAIYNSKRDIYLEGEGVNGSTCLYSLVAKYDTICSQFHQFISDGIFDNSDSTNYSESYHLGLASGYKNVSEMIKNKLAREENNRYRAHINPSQ